MPTHINIKALEENKLYYQYEVPMCLNVMNDQIENENKPALRCQAEFPDGNTLHGQGDT